MCLGKEIALATRGQQSMDFLKLQLKRSPVCWAEISWPHWLEGVTSSYTDIAARHGVIGHDLTNLGSPSPTRGLSPAKPGKLRWSFMIMKSPTLYFSLSPPQALVTIRISTPSAFITRMGKVICKMHCKMSDCTVIKDCTAPDSGFIIQVGVNLVHLHALLIQLQATVIPPLCNHPFCQAKRSHKTGGLPSLGYLYQNVRPSTRLWQSHNSGTTLLVVFMFPFTNQPTMLHFGMQNYEDNFFFFFFLHLISREQNTQVVVSPRPTFKHVYPCKVASSLADLKPTSPFCHKYEFTRR